MNIQRAIADIVTTEDLLERALKLSDKHLHKAFGGKRAPDFSPPSEPTAEPVSIANNT